MDYKTQMVNRFSIDQDPLNCILPKNTNFKFLTLTIFLLLSFGALATHYGTLVIINGQHLGRAQLASLEAQIGTRVAPGNYLVADNGCWFNQSTVRIPYIKNQGGVSIDSGNRIYRILNRLAQVAKTCPGSIREVIRAVAAS